MCIPVLQGLVECGGQFIQVFEAPSFERQRTQLLPPRLDQVQPASILRDEQDLDFRPSRQGEFDLSADMNTEIVFDDQPAIGRELHEDLLQQLNVAGAVSTWAHQNRSLSSRRFERSMSPQLASASIIWFKRGSIGSHDPLFARIGFYCDGTHLIHANDPCSWRTSQVRSDDTPLFSTNSGSCFSASWNQLC